MKCVELKMRADTFFLFCTEKKRSHVCKNAPKKSDLACAKNAINFLEKNAEKR